MRTDPRPSLVVLVATLSLAASAWAAPEVSHVMVRGSFRTWEGDLPADRTASADQGAGRLSLGLRLASNADLVLATSGGTTTTDLGAGEARLARLADLASSLYLRLADDRLLLQAAASVPLGDASVTRAEAPVLEAVAMPLLDFDLRDYAGGLELGGTATWRAVMGPTFGLALGAGTMWRGGYELIVDEGEFRPAMEWAFTAGTDLGPHDEGAPSPARVDLTWRGFGTDRLADVPVFRQGGQWETRLSGQRAFGALRTSGSLSSVWKRANTLLASSGTVIGETQSGSGDQLGLRLRADHDLGAIVTLGLVVDHLRGRNSDDPRRNGHSTGVGPVLVVDATRTLEFELSARYASGRIEPSIGAGTRSLDGSAWGLRLRWSPE